MHDYLAQVWDMHVGRLSGPLSFRMIIQPLVATGLGVRAGLRDARAGRPPFAWTVITDTKLRRYLLREQWSDVKKLFFVAILMDVVYQFIVFRSLYPGQLLTVASILAFPTYFLCRGLTNRIVRSRLRGPDLPPSQLGR